jgi:hypothetical protein
LSLLTGQSLWLPIWCASFQEGSYTNVSTHLSTSTMMMSSGSRTMGTRETGTIVDSVVLDSRLQDPRGEDLCSRRQLRAIGRGRCIQEHIIVGTASSQYQGCMHMG